jgi:hypothetical protein
LREELLTDIWDGGKRTEVPAIPQKVSKNTYNMNKAPSDGDKNGGIDSVGMCRLKVSRRKKNAVKEMIMTKLAGKCLCFYRILRI